MKKLIGCMVLALGLSAMASAQGLVGAPVDPRYGQSMTVTIPKQPPAQPQPPASQGQSSQMLIVGILAVIRIILR